MPTAVTVCCNLLLFTTNNKTIEHNPITVYFWDGTCNITKKQCKCIDIRGKSGDIIPVVIRNLHRASDFVFNRYCKIKFIGVLFYFVSLYYDFKGHLNPTICLDSDKEVEFQVDLLNKHN